VESSQGRAKDHSVEGIGLVRLVGLLMIALSVYWCIAGMVLWWSYDILPKATMSIVFHNIRHA
jgi:hypothetical protein